jgi:hypothetical protein
LLSFPEFNILCIEDKIKEMNKVRSIGVFDNYNLPTEEEFKLLVLEN